ncbi:MAG: IPT/TIG domain-containing protein, partial [Terracidiphilus sp.]
MTSITPATAPAGAASLTLTVNGSGFLSSTTIQVGGVADATTYVSSTEMTAIVGPSQLASGAQLSVIALNGSASSGSGTPVNLQVTNPVPAITQITPVSVVVGSVSQMVGINGTGFVPTTVIDVNGSARTTTYASTTQLVATLTAADVASLGSLSLTAVNAAPGGGTSAVVTVPIVNPPPPTLTSISPNVGPINTAATVTLNGTGFMPNSTVAMNGTNMAATLSGSTKLTVKIPASSLTLPGNLNFTVTTPAPGGGTSASLPYTVYIALANSDLLYNPVDRLLYVAVPGSAGSGIGNCLVGIDPVTGNIMRKIYVGSNPNKLALSSDGTQLFVGLDGAGAVAQVNLTTGQVVRQFSDGTGPDRAYFLAAVPGESNSVAVAESGNFNVTIYDAGVARTSTSSSFGSWSGPLAFDSSASTLYLLDIGYNPAVNAMAVSSTGITGESTLYSGDFTASSIQYDNGRLYLSDGDVLDVSTGALLDQLFAGTNLPDSGGVISDSTLGLAFIVGQKGPAAQVFAVNESTFVPAGSIDINGGGGITKIVRWGQNGLAMSDGVNLFILQSPVVKNLSSSPADVSPALSGPATANTGSAITYTATVTNSGPSQAQGVSLALTLDASLIVNRVSASQGSCGTGSVFSCNLGNLANGASATVTVNATPTAAGTIESTATANSVSYDANSSNNQAMASTIVTGSFYAPAPLISAISPALVQAGSAVQAGSTTFTLTVTGSGFNADSTVNLNGAALATKYVSATQLTAIVNDSAIANYGWMPVTVTTPSPGGGTSQVVPLTIYALVNVPANGILFDPYSQQIYATVPSTSATVTGNSIVTINPNTGAVGTPIAIGSEPNVMAETSDGNYLWVGISGSDKLAQFNLPTQSMTATIPLSYMQSGTATGVAATWLAAMPGSDTTLAMNITNSWDNFGIFDVSGNAGTFRKNFSGIYSGVDPIFADATHLYAYDSQTTGAEFYRYAVDANGLTLIDGTKLDGLGGFKLAD